MIIDCFIFNDELDLLEIRLNELNDVVDYHVLVEAKQNFIGLNKKAVFLENQKRFAAFKNKIIHILIDDFSEAPLVLCPELYKTAISTNDNLPYSLEEYSRVWSNENYQRNAILKGLIKFSSKDYVIISDVDEIPNPVAIRKAITLIQNHNSVITFEQNLYYYFLNGQLTDKWYGSKILRMDSLISPQQIRNIKSGEFVKDGGWHFSYLGGTDQIVKKLLSSSHREFNQEKIIDPLKIKLYTDLGLDILGRPMRINYVTIDSSFPQYVVRNENLFSKYIKVKPVHREISEQIVQMLEDEVIEGRRQTEVLKETILQLKTEKNYLENGLKKITSNTLYRALRTGRRIGKMLKKLAFAAINFVPNLLLTIPFFIASILMFLIAEIGRVFTNIIARKLSLLPSELTLDGVSIVIPTWNKADMIYNNLLEMDRVLQLDENLARKVEIIVINNGSPDNTAEKLEDIKPLLKTKFTLINSNENLGFARGINLGAALAHYNYVYFFNDDMIPKIGFMKNLVNYANHLLGSKIHFFGICSQIFFYDPAKRREESGKTYIRSHLGGFLKVAHCVHPSLLESPSLTAYPGGGSSLINKAAFFQLGGYDSGSYRPMYAEDLDLGMMAWKKGLPSFYCPTSQIIHHHRASSKKSNIDPSVWMFTNWLVVRLKLCDSWELLKTIISFSLLSLVSSRHANYAKMVIRVLPAILTSKIKLNRFKTINKDFELLDFIRFENNNRKSLHNNL